MPDLSLLLIGVDDVGEGSVFERDCEDHHSRWPRLPGIDAALNVGLRLVLDDSGRSGESSNKADV